MHMRVKARNEELLKAFVTKIEAQNLGITRGRLDRAIADGEVAVINSGIGRLRIKRTDVLKILGLSEADIPPKAA